MQESPVAETRLSAKDVYTRLREMILNFEIYPGSRVTETELAEYFGVSRTPIRSALQRLEAEGYLTVLPKQGCFIRNLDIDDLSKYYQVRKTLEQLSLQLANTYMSDTALSELAAAWDPARQVDRSDDPEEMEARDETFHLALAEGGGNLILRNYLADVNRHLRIVRRLGFTRSERIDQTYDDHYRICQSLLRRDLAEAQTLMRDHIQHVEQFVKTITLTQLAINRNHSFPAKKTT
ncbi:GntR family transcriptional regulator [Thiobacillus sp.]|uniref:GntR family transcriptional regulator n=1 Tax=Thiobacillus sp. TaxID=924 RepID=UPI0025FF3290|nr:GntR family transcriptional regulator [Thiobacillus sp.]MBT9538548.1 GntR family transcriptional regulator [Thiobacillus sp.]